MFSFGFLFCDQHHSARRALRAAGVYHSDVTNVRLVVGSMLCSTQTRFAHCSMVAQATKVLQEGPWYSRLGWIRGNAIYDKPRELHGLVQGRAGYVYMEGMVVTNGDMHFFPDLRSVQFLPVNDPDDRLLLNKPEGQPAARRFLESLVS